MSELEARRLAQKVDTAKNNSEVSPVDLLRVMANEIESGKLKVDGLLLSWIDRGGSRWEHGSYRYNLTYDQEIVLIELAKVSCFKRWIASD